MVELRLVDLEEDALRRRVASVRVRRRHAELRHPGRVVIAGRRTGTERRAVEDEEASVCGVARVERQSEQPALVVLRHERDQPAAHVEERRGQEVAVRGKHADDAGLVHDEAASARIGCRDERHRGRETFSNKPETDGRSLRLLRPAGRCGHPGRDDRAERGDDETTRRLHRTLPPLEAPDARLRWPRP